VFLVPEAYFDGLGVKVGLSGGERRATFETYTTTTIIMMMAVVAPTAQHRRLINIGNEAGRQLVCVCEGERERGREGEVIYPRTASHERTRRKLGSTRGKDEQVPPKKPLGLIPSMFGEVMISLNNVERASSGWGFEKRKGDILGNAMG
jgi:hypothetical protein